jgi:hypothetical protein
MDYLFPQYSFLIVPLLAQTILSLSESLFTFSSLLFLSFPIFPIAPRPLPLSPRFSPYLLFPPCLSFSISFRTFPSLSLNPQLFLPLFLTSVSLLPPYLSFSSSLIYFLTYPFLPLPSDSFLTSSLLSSPSSNLFPHVPFQSSIFNYLPDSFLLFSSLPSFSSHLFLYFLYFPERYSPLPTFPLSQYLSLHLLRLPFTLSLFSNLPPLPSSLPSPPFLSPSLPSPPFLSPPLYLSLPLLSLALYLPLPSHPLPSSLHSPAFLSPPLNNLPLAPFFSLLVIHTISLFNFPLFSSSCYISNLTLVITICCP